MSIEFTPKLRIALPDDNEKAWGSAYRQGMIDAEERLTRTFNGNPNGNVAGDYIGQKCLDTANLLLYHCTTVGNAASAVWSLTKVTADMVPDGTLPLAKLAVLPPTVPVGVVIPYAGQTIADPAWMLCHGQELNRATYAELFAVLGTVYGVGDNATTFNLPDLRGRVAAGKDDMGGAAAGRLTNLRPGGVNGNVLGGTGGEEAHTQTLDELFPHNHSIKIGQAGDNVINFVARASSPNQVGWYWTESTGGEQAMNVVQPTIVLNYIIKVL